MRKVEELEIYKKFQEKGARKRTGKKTYLLQPIMCAMPWRWDLGRDSKLQHAALTFDADGPSHPQAGWLTYGVRESRCGESRSDGAEVAPILTPPAAMDGWMDAWTARDGVKV